MEKLNSVMDKLSAADVKNATVAFQEKLGGDGGHRTIIVSVNSAVDPLETIGTILNAIKDVEADAAAEVEVDENCDKKHSGPLMINIHMSKILVGIVFGFAAYRLYTCFV